MTIDRERMERLEVARSHITTDGVNQSQAIGETVAVIPWDDFQWLMAAARERDELRAERDAFKEEANALRRNYIRETNELSALVDAAEATIARLKAENARLREALQFVLDNSGDPVMERACDAALAVAPEGTPDVAASESQGEGSSRHAALVPLPDAAAHAPPICRCGTTLVCPDIGCDLHKAPEGTPQPESDR